MAAQKVVFAEKNFPPLIEQAVPPAMVGVGWLQHLIPKSFFSCGVCITPAALM
jgi:hypothetical protein